MTVLRLRQDALAWREVDGELIGVDVRTAEYLAANPSGLLLWRSLEVGASREQLVALLRDTYGIDATRAASDVDSFVDVVRKQGLLEP